MHVRQATNIVRAFRGGGQGAARDGHPRGGAPWRRRFRDLVNRQGKSLQHTPVAWKDDTKPRSDVISGNDVLFMPSSRLGTACRLAPVRDSQPEIRAALRPKLRDAGCESDPPSDETAVNRWAWATRWAWARASSWRVASLTTPGRRRRPSPRCQPAGVFRCAGFTVLQPWTLERLITHAHVPDGTAGGP